MTMSATAKRAADPVATTLDSTHSPVCELEMTLYFLVAWQVCLLNEWPQEAV